jgi:site-specific DNA-methyltransferase (adenine-specific)
MENRIIKKNTLSFSCSKSMKYLRTPIDIWKDLIKEFNFTIDVCASDNNHLLPRYYTKEIDCLIQDLNNEIAYVHPLFDGKIGKFVEKAYNSIGTFVFLLPASTHTKYFHNYFYKNPNVEIRFLRKPNKGFRFLNDDGTDDDQSKLGYIKPLMICIMNNKVSKE